MRSPKEMTHSDAEIERRQGSVERVTFHSEESGFCVLRVKIRGQRDLVTVVGSAAIVTAGGYVECEGLWNNDRQHGLQFKAQHLRVVPPSTLEGIEKYLGSGMVKGIGPHFARKLVRAFGETVFDVIEQEPDKLLELEGIGPKRKERVTQAWAEQKVVRETIEGETALFLTPLYCSEKGVASHLARQQEGALPWGEIDTRKAIPWVEEQTGLQLSPSQRQAVSSSVDTDD